MITKELIEILEIEKNELKRYLELALEKQDALINRNRELLDSINKNEEDIILKIKKIELQRINEIKKIYNSNNINSDKYKISEFIECFEKTLDVKQTNYLTKSDEFIKNTIKNCLDVNNNNNFLIKHSIKFIDNTINTILGIKKRNFVDRKV